METAQKEAFASQRSPIMTMMVTRHIVCRLDAHSAVLFSPIITIPHIIIRGDELQAALIGHYQSHGHKVKLRHKIKGGKLHGFYKQTYLPAALTVFIRAIFEASTVGL